MIELGEYSRLVDETINAELVVIDASRVALMACVFTKAVTLRSKPGTKPLLRHIVFEEHVTFDGAFKVDEVLFLKGHSFAPPPVTLDGSEKAGVP